MFEGREGKTNVLFESLVAGAVEYSLFITCPTGIAGKLKRFLFLFLPSDLPEISPSDEDVLCLAAWDLGERRGPQAFGAISHDAIRDDEPTWSRDCIRCLGWQIFGRHGMELFISCDFSLYFSRQFL